MSLRTAFRSAHLLTFITTTLIFCVVTLVGDPVAPDDLLAIASRILVCALLVYLLVGHTVLIFATFNVRATDGEGKQVNVTKFSAGLTLEFLAVMLMWAYLWPYILFKSTARNTTLHGEATVSPFPKDKDRG